ncbi:MAG TPA: DNA polymerase, partial [Candidatus Saccharimonadales bacterium]|nr:DNA polymerase [Candidatus Saccharimonadales bacterium]
MIPKAPHANCQECPLRNNAFVPSSGPEDADVIVVSRSAGYYDVQARRPFSGPSGKLLDYLLEESGRSRDTTRVTNVVLCACDAVPDEAIKCCAPRLRAEITAYPRRVIIAAGAEPTRELTPFRTVGNARGQVLDTPIGKVVATSNPAAALRDDTAFPDLVADFKRALVPRKPFVPPVVYYTEDIDEAFDYISHLSQYSFLSCDIEARGLEYNSDLVSLAMCGSEGEAFVFGRNLVRPGNPFLRILDSFFRRGNTGITEGNGIVHGIVEADNLRGLQRLQLLADVAIQRVDFCWHNGQYDTKVLRFHGVQARVDQDTLLLHYCVDERGGLELHSLDHCLQYELDWPDYTPEIVVKGKKCGFTNIKPDEWPVVYRYNGFDAAGGYRLYRHLRPLAMDADVLRHYDTLLIPGSNALSHIEEGGVLYDIRKARRIAKNDLDPNMRELTFQAECIVGERINLRSPQQSAKFLYETCGAPDPGIKGKVKSVDKEAREFLTNTDWIDRRVREYVGILGDFSRLAKIKGTYIDGLIKRVDEDGRLRGNFLLQGTETGRLSSRRPNLQNQPRGTQIRQLYYAPEGRVIVQADYSQAELRTAAILSGDAGLQRIYLEGRDLHSEIARLRYGDRFSSEQRVKA